MSDALPLPSRPDLEQYKKLAKDLQAACKSRDSDAFRERVTRWVETLAETRRGRLSRGAVAPVVAKTISAASVEIGKREELLIVMSAPHFS
jgi:hypothetical protein